ncbi:flagellar hook protein FlgE [Desulfotomaculum arcticum]|uniref:Flagellar hook protein FlgE n=1 Tax=Desulfotruncus arcticus DSM 17038 TaxID=1121424 RepID=A0A1I2N382_9FIRM|nr:flagellar hook-basal body complex protein [Desulfotruncus arcticus]SFF95986.1 flagellar hook protein FlgE [Desulfotomaculum arcticum] [Desulfotruncus arcticus DSM 17038]
MIRLMSSGVSGMRNHQVRMDVIGNNISNVNTTGYKTGRADFQDTLYQTMGAAGVAGGYQIGTGVSVGSVSSNINQGPLQATGRLFDFAISGQGFFGVVDDNDNLMYTRDGSFFIDKDGNLVNSSGLQVVDSDESPIVIELDEDQSLDDISITKTGEIFLDDDSLGTIGLFSFTNPAGLIRAGDNLFTESENTGDRVSNADEPEGFGQIRSGYLEMANIDIADELANLIATQRGFQANAKTFSTADEILQDIIQLKR